MQRKGSAYRKQCGNTAPIYVKSMCSPIASLPPPSSPIQPWARAFGGPVAGRRRASRAPPAEVERDPSAPTGAAGRQNSTGLTRLADKDKWIQLERVRWAKVFGVPMSEASPPNFPPNTLHLQRVLCALSLQTEEATGAGGKTAQELLAQSLTRLWYAFWVDHADVGKAEVFEPILSDVLGKERYSRGECVWCGTRGFSEEQRGSPTEPGREGTRAIRECLSRERLPSLFTA